MRILVTNDDGIESEGIHVLSRALAETGNDVVVVAPARDWSGAGAAIGSLHPDTPLDVARATIPGAPDIAAWALDGPPALCTVAARLGAFGDAPDVVVSGINAGVNTGRAVIHSGTVGAALAAQNSGTSGLAVSVEWADEWHWETAAQIAVETLDLLVSAPAGSVLNLNVPARPRSEVHGVRWARLAPFGSVRASLVARGETALQFEFHPDERRPADDTDEATIRDGWASLTTIVGAVEAWPGDATPVGDEGAIDPSDADRAFRLVPGAELHPVHTVPDGQVASHLSRSFPTA